MRRVIAIFLLSAMLCMCNRSFAQNVNGHWYGVGLIQDARQSNSYLTELIVRQKGKTVWGELLYYFKDSLVKTQINGSFDKESGRLTIKPFGIIYYKSPSARNSIEATMSGYFRLVASKTESVLQGSLMSDAEHRFTVPDISYRLKKSNDTVALVMQDDPIQDTVKPVFIPAPKKIIPETTVAKKPVIVDNKPKDAIPKPAYVPIKPKDTVIPKPAVIIPVTPINMQTVEDYAKRDKEVTKELLVLNSVLKVELYDNGEIDNDSISVFLNNKLILPESKLDLTAIKLTIELDSTLEYSDLTMFAINLGNIPPNTALLVLYDGNVRYEVFLSSDLSRSATLRLRKKKAK